MKLADLVEDKQVIPKADADWFVKYAKIKTGNGEALLSGPEIVKALRAGEHDPMFNKKFNTSMLRLDFKNEELTSPSKAAMDRFSEVFDKIISHTSIWNANIKNGLNLFIPTTSRNKRVYLVNGEISSFKFPSDIKIYVLQIENVKVNCGLLGILKNHGIHGVEGYYSDENGKPRDESDSKMNKAFNIVSKHMDTDRDIIECQNDLIDAGLEEFAKL